MKQEGVGEIVYNFKYGGLGWSDKVIFLYE